MKLIEDSSMTENPSFDDKTSDLVADHVIDITADICPMTFVRTRLALDRMTIGSILCVLLKGAEPLRNVPRTAITQGHQVLRIDAHDDGGSAIWLRRGES